MPQSQTTYGYISPKQQLHFLNKLFQKIKTETHLAEQDKDYFQQIEKELAKYNKSLFEKRDLQELIQAIKQIIATIESTNKESRLLKHFNEFGVYRIFYHNSVIRAEDDTSDLVSPLKHGFIGVGVSALITALFAASAFLGAPVWVMVIATALFATSVTYLSGLIYGVVNDLFATKANLPYFLLGHQPQQHSLLRTNDPAAQGIAWGVAATHGLSLLAGIAFGIGTVITASFVPMASFIFPVMLLAMPLIAWGADIYARRKAKQYVKEGYKEYGPLDYLQLGSNFYQREGLALMSGNKEDKAAWLANGDRNGFGFSKLPIIGVGVLATAITLSAVHSFLPALLFSSLLATTVPVAFAAAAILFLAAAGVYMYVNRNRQIDNKYKLSFEQGRLEHELYLDEDLTLVEQLSKDFKVNTATMDTTSVEPAHFASPLRGVKPKLPAVIESKDEEHTLSIV